MINQEILCQKSISIRKLPINLNQSDLRLFEHELKRVIPETSLFHLKDVTIYSDGILFRDKKILAESFPSIRFMNSWMKSRAHLNFLVRNLFLRQYEESFQDAFWITDTWSDGYFHWMTDALPKLFAIRGKIGNSTLLLPGKYQTREFIVSSLKPFHIQDVKFIHEALHCENLNMSTHTAPTGNYNENIIRDLRSFYTNFYQKTHSDCTSNKIYISRGKAKKRKIINEEECIKVLEEYGFKIVYFEDHSFEEQVKIALDAQYLISNHGAGLTNMLFMKSGGCVFELRQNGDTHSNCYFSMASALNLNYFYQLCNSKNSNEKPHTAKMIVDCQVLRKSIEQMLAV